MDVNKLVSVYVKIRDARSELKREFTEKDDDLKSQLEKVSRVLLDYAKDNDMSSMKTAAGTVSRVKKTKYWPSDWDSFFTYMKDYGGPEMFMTRNLNQAVFKEFLEQYPDAKPPINSDSSYSISVRKGGKK